MRTQIHVSLRPEALFDFDAWREKRRLSRGDALEALLRLAAGGGEVADVGNGVHGRLAGRRALEATTSPGRVVELEEES